MKTGTSFQTSCFALVALLTVGACAARAQEPPTPPPPATQPPVQPPVTEPPGTQQAPPAQPTPAPGPTPAAAVVAPPKAEFTDGELRRRRDAIYLMEGLLVNTVKLAARRTQSQIEEAVPELSVTLFSAIPPQATGIHLEDYGVVFNVIIPTYQDSVVNILNMIPRGRPDPAQPTAAGPPPAGLPLNPTLIYVQTVRDSLIDAMLKYGQSLDLRQNEWLAIAARGEGGPGPVSEPSVLILRVKGSDLNEFHAGRLSLPEVEKRVQVKPFSGGR